MRKIGPFDYSFGKNKNNLFSKIILKKSFQKDEPNIPMSSS